MTRVTVDGRATVGAMVAATVIEMHNAGLDGSFYYHLWDQVCDAGDFAPFFSAQGVANILHHWNEAPHRLGLFGIDGQVRPPYFVYWMLAQLGETQVAASTDDVAVRALAGRDARRLSVMLVNHSLDAQQDRVATCSFSNLEAGMKQLTVYRLDQRQRWDAERLELLPVEQRQTYTQQTYQCQIGLPANSVVLVTLST